MMYNLIYILIIDYFITYVHPVLIVNMQVPEVIQYGSKSAVVLDCDYVTENTTGLVVKWFLNDRSRPVYQWIPPKEPQVLGILKGKVDLSYKASTEEYKMHRAIRLFTPGTELTGDYTCVVSTFLAEDQRTKPMTIFVPERKFTLIEDKLHDGFVNVICSAEGMYPKPNITLTSNGRTLPGVRTSVTRTNARFTAVASATLAAGTLSPRAPILCELIIQRANYVSRRSAVFDDDEDITTTTTSFNTDKEPMTVTEFSHGNSPTKAAELRWLITIALFILLVNTKRCRHH